MNEESDCLKLSNQLCFPLYAAAKEIVRKYTPFLEPLDLTYTQYITMMSLWEKKNVTVKELGDLLYLNSGTLTPLLKKIETKGYITRSRSKSDERNLIVSITAKGEKLKDKAISIPQEMKSCVKLNPDEAKTLYTLLHKLLS